MNYTLTIDLQGADKAEGAIDSLMAKVKDIGSGKMPSFMDWMDAGSEAPVEGEKIGDKFADGITKGATKKLKSFNILDAWGKSVFKSIKDGQDLWKDAVNLGIKDSNGKTVRPEWWKVGGDNMQGPDLNGEARRKNSASTKIDWKKLLLGIGIGVTGNDYVGSRLISDQLGKGGAGGVAGGLFGKGGIVGFAEIFAAFKAFKFAIGIFKSAAELFSNSVAQARDFYAKSLQSGLGLNYQIKRSMLAQLLGVSETDINKFGAAVAYLNPKISYAASVLAKTNAPLTTTGIEFGVLKYDLDALVATLSSDVAPAITLFIRALEGIVNGITKLLNNKYFQLFMKITAPEFALIGLLNKVQGATGGNIPSPQSFMKQLPASTWEHMGLAIGSGGNTTNDLIRKSNSYLKVIATAVMQGGVPRGSQFGLSPTVSNP